MRACVCVPTALVVRLKPNGVAKSRRCVRGGCAKGTQQHSTSAPKAGRCLVRICLSRADNLRYDVIACDIRQAFIQAGVFPPKDKYYILPPPCVSLVGLSAVVKYRINPPPTAPDIPHRLLFGCNLPSYGSADAPLMRYVTLASRLRKRKYYSRRVDLCRSSRVGEKSGVITAYSHALGGYTDGRKFGWN